LSIRASCSIIIIPMSEQPQAGGDDLASEWRREIDRLLRQGPRARVTLIHLADRGDWRARTLAVSALGILVRNDPSAHRPSFASALAKVPGIRRSLNTVGRHGRLVSRSLLNAAVDRSFIVRTAAALALGECRDARLADRLAMMLTDPFRPVRAAAGAALRACGGSAVATAVIDAAPEPTPALIGEGVATLDWLGELARAHRDLLRTALSGVDDAAASRSDDDVVRWLAGPLAAYGTSGASAEAERYEDEIDLQYQLAKPFGAHDRSENIRQLDAFVALVSHLELPRGARIVDLGGGSGWAGELLARFGFAPVVLDVSPALLRLARQRLDRTRSKGLVAAADMTALPLRAGSVDAVLAIDALHHVGDLEAVFREVKRVLIAGGLILLAEPGEGHAESAKTLAESREHGVRESEVHPHAVAQLARRAGFDDVGVIPRVPTRTLMNPEELRRAAAGRTGRSRVLAEGQATEFDTLVLRTMLARPLMVMRAGTRVPDSRAPDVLAADIQPSLDRRGRHLVGGVDLRNTGNTTWVVRAIDGVGVVSLGVQLLDIQGRLLNREFLRCRLPGPVEPGAQVRIGLDVLLPDADTGYRLKLDLVAEQVCWFEDRGSRPAYVDA
jgi:ubiquinone/menaquinone biosynthesis C-methylase UbiE